MNEPPDSDREVLLHFTGAVAHLRLNRPDALNAFSFGLVSALADALDEIDHHPDCRVIIVTGAGRAFSAGGDLKEFRRRLDGGGSRDLVEFVTLVAHTLTRIERNPRPVIAAVSGLAVAGGLELILCCDIVLAAREVRIGDGHLRYGVLPGGGGAARLVRKLPVNVASRLLLTGELVSAEYLCEQGLVNEVLDADALYDRATELAERISTLSPLAVRRLKRIAREISDVELERGLSMELLGFAEHIESADFREGITAFAERRSPVFPPAMPIGGIP